MMVALWEIILFFIFYFGGITNTVNNIYFGQELKGAKQKTVE